MSAPVIERRAGAAAPPRIPQQRSGRATTTATDDRPRRAAATERDRSHSRRATFVLVVMTLLATGLVTTLWLSTAAAADSYRLQEARTRAGALTEQSEALRREVTAMNSPAALAARATAQGLVPVQDPARLVVGPDGRVTVVGEPIAAHPNGPTPPAVPGPQQPSTPTSTATPDESRAGTGDPGAAPGATGPSAGGAGTPAGGRG